jgi:tryptophanyl-tRNA synthetase
VRQSGGERESHPQSIFRRSAGEMEEEEEKEVSFTCESKDVTCVNCKKSVTTVVEEESTASTDMLAVLLFVSVKILFCCPYVYNVSC